MSEPLKIAKPVFNGLAPSLDVGPRGLSVHLDFATQARYLFDLVKEQNANQITDIQSIWVDNADNTQRVVLTFNNTGQRIVIPAGQQVLQPIISGSNLEIEAVCIGSTTRVHIIFLNVPMPYTFTGPVSVDVQNVTATFTPTPGTFDNFSDVTTPATSTQLFAANNSAIRRIVQNPGNNPESIYIEFGGVPAAIGTAIEILPGASFDTGTGPIDRTEWTIIATNAVPYIAKEMEAIP